MDGQPEEAFREPYQGLVFKNREDARALAVQAAKDLGIRMIELGDDGVCGQLYVKMKLTEPCL